MADIPVSKTIDIRVSSSLLHDLRTPLNQIIGYSEILEEEAVNSGREDFIPDLQRINQAAREMVIRLDTMFASPAKTGLQETGGVLDFNPHQTQELRSNSCLPPPDYLRRKGL